MNTATRSTCPKCNGRKRLERYSGIAEGVCFECKGAGFVTATKARSAIVDGPAFDLTEERALDQLRVWYHCAVRQGGVWGLDEEQTGVGMRSVAIYAAAVNPAKRAQVLAAFEALQA